MGPRWATIFAGRLLATVALEMDGKKTGGTGWAGFLLFHGRLQSRFGPLSTK